MDLMLQPKDTEWLNAYKNKTHIYAVYKKPTSNNTREDSMHEHHQMLNTKIRSIIFFAAKDGEALYSQQKQDQELTGSDHELIIAKFRLKLKKVGKITRPFRYDLNQIP